MSGLLISSPAEVVQHLLVQLDLATLGVYPTEDEWPCFESFHPDQPDDSICCYNTEGRIQGRTHIDGETQEQHGFQVRVRSASSTTGFSKANAIADAFDRVAQDLVTVDGEDYLVWSITRTGAVLALGLETPSSRRRLWTVNALITLRQQP